MPIETRSNSALFRRAEQLKRWEDSETNQVSTEVPPNKKSKIKFSDGCIFLAACAAGDTEEVERLLEQGADINTANVDGLTALHQACIDDNLEMVQFLVEHGCNVNQGDNEGWTPLHATASCGFVSIAKYLIEHGANVAAVNNDGDLPIDITESPKMEELLSDVLDEQGIDCDEARSEEERIMLEDASQWLNSQKYQDQIHPRTGATALHVAAAKGYIKVMNILIKAGADLNAQDYDGWTPLHAAAHWGQKEACAVLADNLANMDIQNFAGQTCFDVAEPELLKLLEELKKKQASMQKDRPEIQAVLQRTSTKPPLKRRTSVTRMSCQEKSKSVMKDTKAERAQIEQLSLPEEDMEEDKERKHLDVGDRTQNQKSDMKRQETDIHLIRKTPEIPALEASAEKEAVPERIPSWKKVLRRSQENLADDSKSLSVPEPEVVMKRPRHVSEQEMVEPSNGPAVESGSVEGRIIENIERSSSDTSNHSTEDSSSISPSVPSSSDISLDSQSQGKRSFIPPVRDEESELQRKAHAKRVRETRRSTQGVLLEDVKTAELQYIIKKTQAERTETSKEEEDAEATNTADAGQMPENKKPSTNVPKDESVCANNTEKSSNMDVDNTDNVSANKPAVSSSTVSSPSVTLVLKTKTPSNSDEQSSPDSRTSALGTQAAIQRRRRPKRRSTGVVYLDSDDAVEDKDENEKQTSYREKAQEVKETSGISERSRHRFASSETSSRSDTPSRASSLSCSKNSLNEDVEKDYKKLYEELKAENERLLELEKENAHLREALKKTEEELERTKSQLTKLLESNNAKNAVSDAEKKERRALERKLSEMEEEVKNISKLKTENEKLKAENRALSRVVCKLSK